MHLVSSCLFELFGDCLIVFVGVSTIGWMEHYVCMYDLEVVRRVVVIHHSTYGHMDVGGAHIDVSIRMIRL